MPTTTSTRSPRCSTCGSSPATGTSPPISPAACATSRRADATGCSTRCRPRRRSALDRPGPIAEMLEPDLKNGGGGLRDVQAPGWAAWALPAGGAPEPDLLDGEGWNGGVERLVARGYLQPDDPDRLRDARARAPRSRASRSTGSRAADPTGCRCRTRTRWPRSWARPTPTISCGGWVRRRGPSCGSRATSGRGCSRPRRVRVVCGRRPATWATASCGVTHGSASPRRNARHRHRAAGGGACGTRPGAVRAGRAHPADRAHRGHVGRRRARRVHRPARRGTRCDPGVRDPRPRRAARAVAPRVGVGAGTTAAQRIPPLHRRSALARSGRRVRRAAR